LAVIAEKADGGMRDALSIFDQAVSFCQGNITYQKVIEDLNVLDAENYFKIVDLSLANKVADIMVLLNQIINKGFDGGLLIQGLARHVRNVLMARDEQTLPLLEVSEQQRERYKQQAQKCPIPFLYKALQLMNQCDLGYRQSSNKRLLVELTLIEVAQITQPADADVPGSGRRPRRLKSLFKQLVQKAQPARSAQQVAAAAPVGTTEATTSPQSATTTTTSTDQASAPAAQPSAPRRQLKSAIGFSWNNVRQMAKPKKMVVIPGTLDSSDPNARPKDELHEFGQQDLELQWLSMCNRMPQKLSGIATRMKNMNPRITTFPAVEVTVENQLAYDQIDSIKGSIVNTLKLYLHNSAITLSIRIAEHTSEVKILTRREQYEQMEQQNPSVGKLRQMFGLELA
ncbi:MAG: DNA polymerase III subunit gamma/tau, partial [Prevotella sp.]|nr:DNA polymerase III subunit gamma/tau [Prevotella sp.]